MEKQVNSRRAFLKKASSTLFVGTFSFSLLKAAAIEAQKTGKPVLTGPNLNKFITKAVQNPKSYGQYVKQAQQNLPRFLGTHFTLTSLQKQKVQTMPDSSQKELFGALNESIVFLRDNIRTIQELFPKDPPPNPAPMIMDLPDIPDDIEVDIESETTTIEYEETRPDGTTIKVKIKVKKVRRKDKAE